MKRIRYIEKIADETIKRYNERLSKYGPSPKTLGWLKGRQGTRFSVLTSIGNMNNASVLDVGSGFGDLYGFLKYKKYRFSYLGLELNSNLIDVGKRRYPNAKFSEFNIDVDKLKGKFDWVIISGLFNYKRANKYQFIEETLNKVFQICKKGVSADFMSSYVDFKNKEANYSSPEKVFRICKKITRRVVIRHDYMPFEFCIHMYRDEKLTKDLVFSEYSKSLDVKLRTNDWLNKVSTVP
jgi:SAM-dependent methyltransferase